MAQCIWVKGDEAWGQSLGTSLGCFTSESFAILPFEAAVPLAMLRTNSMTSCQRCLWPHWHERQSCRGLPSWAKKQTNIFEEEGHKSEGANMTCYQPGYITSWPCMLQCPLPLRVWQNKFVKCQRRRDLPGSRRSRSSRHRWWLHLRG